LGNFEWWRGGGWLLGARLNDFLHLLALCVIPQKLDRLDALLFGLIDKRRKEVADGSRAKSGRVDLLGACLCVWMGHLH
jgi:hypothetical protein